MQMIDAQPWIMELKRRVQHYILTGDVRYLWKHVIPSRKSDRHNGQIIQRLRGISLTFRRIKFNLNEV